LTPKIIVSPIDPEKNIAEIIAKYG